MAREVREHYDTGRPLLIAVTGWKKPSDRILAQLAGFDHHLPKPFESHQLLKLLEARERRLATVDQSSETSPRWMANLTRPATSRMPSFSTSRAR